MAKKISLKSKSGRKVAVKQFEKTLKEVGTQTSKYYAHLFKAYIQQVIEQQQYNWAALSDDYVDWKRYTGLDSRIFIATGEYVDSIQTFKHINPDTKQIGYLVGVPHKKHSGSKVYLDHLANILEFGTRNMPARPHWRPALSQFIRSKK